MLTEGGKGWAGVEGFVCSHLGASSKPGYNPLSSSTPVLLSQAPGACLPVSTNGPHITEMESQTQLASHLWATLGK